MKIGIIGAGNIGATLARKLAASGHEVKLANSRGPDTIRDLARELGATAVTREEAVQDVDVVVLSLPFAAYPDLAGLFDAIPAEVVVIDTANYYPFRDGEIGEIEAGKPESVWVSEQVKRPVVKAWNAVLSHTLAEKGKPGGEAGRIAIPVAGDDAGARETAMALVRATGFDAFDAGPLAESWRQQPGTPAYCTELALDALARALAAADKHRAPANRESLIKEFMAGHGKLTHEDIVMRNRTATANKEGKRMKIGILGVGHIGKTLARALAAAGHQVKVANSRGPETIDPDVLATGARAVLAAQAVEDVDVLILSIPLNRIPAAAALVARLPAEAVVIDTSNYYPARDTTIEAVEAGQVESIWVVEQLGRPVVKAWNAIGSDSFARKGMAPGTPGRIAIPVAADRVADRKVGMALVEDTGFDAVDAGSLADSWRQQPGAPAYCTDLTREEMPAALAAAERSRLPKRRDLAVAAFVERLGDGTTNPDAEYGVRLSRALFM